MLDGIEVREQKIQQLTDHETIWKGPNAQVLALKAEIRTMSDVKAVVHAVGMQRVLDELLQLVHQEIQALPAGTDNEYLHVLRLDLHIARKRYSSRHKLEGETPRE